MWVRIVTAVAALVSAAVHLVLWFDGYRDIEVIGPAFLLNAVAGAVIAALLVTGGTGSRPSSSPGSVRAPWGRSCVSATVGLFGVNETWSGGWVLTAAASEVVCIVGGLLLLREEWAARSASERSHAHV